ncbi:chemokine vCXCL10 [Cercopithecine betaherpesvirus 5]|uniref:Chemokine vCXCL10 n=1 Tax=Simian cytomegalovirus (strain Colburn) TaxID=50292 RepID=G8XTJ1_SCMVC|nr:chemokine vCXCL10 [Cercopithecine betaherpesvirus 5]AEV80483.1 chemokine vCXCL10 [Cercopithecine betaherpesvirus 5]
MRCVVSLICCIIGCCYLLSAQPVATQRQRCHCNYKKLPKFIPRKADCLWIHHSNDSCGSEAIAHFPATVMRKGKLQKPLCLNYNYVNRTVKNVTDEGLYCIQRVNGSRWLTICTNCTEENLHQRVRDIWEQKLLVWQRMLWK